MKKVCLLFLSIVFFLSCMAQEKTDSIDTDSINKKEIVENNHSSASSWNKASDNQRVDNMGFVSVLLISAGVSLVVGLILGFRIKSLRSKLYEKNSHRKTEYNNLIKRLDGIDQKIAKFDLEVKKVKADILDNSKAVEKKVQQSDVVSHVSSPVQNVYDGKKQNEYSKSNSVQTSVDSKKEQNEEPETINKVKLKSYADSPGEGGDVFRDVFSSPKNSSMFVITYCEGETTGEFTLMDSPAAVKRFIEGIDVHSKNTANYVGSGMTINQKFSVPGTVELTADKKWQIKEKMNLKFE